MVAEPKPRVTPGVMPQLPRIGQRAKPTIPFAPEHVALLSEEYEIRMREVCKRCRGRGHLDDEQTQCIVCGVIWSRRNVEEHGQRWIKRTLLPCRHTTTGRVPDYAPAPCPDCDGSPVGRGYVPHWVRLGDLLPWMRDWFERWYADFSAKTTAVRATTPPRSQHGQSF